MSTKGVADIVFCLDASASMQPCINGVRRHVIDFIAGLESNQQFKWDWRIDFVAHCAGDDSGGLTSRHQSLHCPCVIDALYGKGQQTSGEFFTRSIEEFSRGLEGVRVEGDEAPLIALDCCLDFPWRHDATCHRVIILMTDEPFETGVGQDMQKKKLKELIAKIQKLRVMLFIIGPESAVFDELAAVDRSEYEVVEFTGNGLAQVDFRQVLSYIGKSLSVPTQQVRTCEPTSRGIFGQAQWVRTDREVRGA